MEFFTEPADVLKVIRASALAELEEVIQPLQNAVNFLRREAPARYLVPSITHIVISDVTAAALFEGLWRLDKSRAPEIAKAIGENAGARFADFVWSWLDSIGRVPGDDKALLQLWTEIDSSANWGRFEYSWSEGHYFIHVADSFLTRSAEPPNHDYCTFLQGYIFGFMWTSLKEMRYWLTNAARASVASQISPPGVLVKCSGRRCAFEFKTGADRLPDAFFQLMSARHLMRTQPHLIDAQVAPLRRSLESAFKTALGLGVNDRFEHALRASRGVLTHGDYVELSRSAEIVHRELSGHTHANPDAVLAKDRVAQLENEVVNILKALEWIEIGEDKKRQIRDEVVRRQSAKAARESETQGST